MQPDRRAPRLAAARSCRRLCCCRQLRQPAQPPLQRQREQQRRTPHKRLEWERTRRRQLRHRRSSKAQFGKRQSWSSKLQRKLKWQPQENTRPHRRQRAQCRGRSLATFFRRTCAQAPDRLRPVGWLLGAAPASPAIDSATAFASPAVDAAVVDVAAAAAAAAGVAASQGHRSVASMRFQSVVAAAATTRGDRRPTGVSDAVGSGWRASPARSQLRPTNAPSWSFWSSSSHWPSSLIPSSRLSSAPSSSSSSTSSSSASLSSLHSSTSASSSLTETRLTMLLPLTFSLLVLLATDMQLAAATAAKVHDGSGSSSSSGGSSSWPSALAHLTDYLPYHTNPSRLVVCPRHVRQGQPYRLVVSLFGLVRPMTVSAVIQRDGVEVAREERELAADGRAELITLKLPSRLPLPAGSGGGYRLRVEGVAAGELAAAGGPAFADHVALTLLARPLTVLVQVDRPLYRQGRTVSFRVVPVTTDYAVHPEALDVFLLNPAGVLVRSWLARTAAAGGWLALDHALAAPATQRGRWTIRVRADGYAHDDHFFVENYYTPEFEVRVRSPSFIVASAQFLRGVVCANYTNGAPVTGNISVTAHVRAISDDGDSRHDSRGYEMSLDSFYGVWYFEFPIRDLLRSIKEIQRFKLVIKARVMDAQTSIVRSGFSESLIFRKSYILRFEGPAMQVFKPGLPFRAYLELRYQDGSPVESEWFRGRPVSSYLRATIFVPGLASQPKLQLPRVLLLDATRWELQIDATPNWSNSSRPIFLEVHFNDAYFGTERIKLVLLPEFSENSHHISISTSTRDAKAGEYIIFHVRANYYVESFQYLVMSKGVIVKSGIETMTSSVRTFAVTLTKEMAPQALIIIYDVTTDQRLLADSLKFSVDGVSLNKVTAHGTHRERSGATLDLTFTGDVGSFVGMSSQPLDVLASYIHHPFSSRKLTSAMNFDDSVLPHASQVDAFSTFQASGLVVFGDVRVGRRSRVCSAASGYASCFDGSCYRAAKMCNGVIDCADGADEFACHHRHIVDWDKFRRTRRNLVSSDFEPTWLWRDVVISASGRTTITVPAPSTQYPWALSAVAISPYRGICTLANPEMVNPRRPFLMTVEAPTAARIGEHFSVRVALINRGQTKLEVLLTLANSLDYKFVYVNAAAPAGVQAGSGDDDPTLSGRHRRHSDAAHRARSTPDLVGSFALDRERSFQGRVGGRHSRQRLQQHQQQQHSKQQPKQQKESRGRQHQYQQSMTMYGEHQHLVFLWPQRPVVLLFPIAGMRPGATNLTVAANTHTAKLSTSTTIELLPAGFERTARTSLLLDVPRGGYVIKQLATGVSGRSVLPRHWEPLAARHSTAPSASSSLHAAYRSYRHFGGSVSAAASSLAAADFNAAVAEITVSGSASGAPPFSANSATPVRADTVFGLPTGTADANLYSFAANLIWLQLAALAATVDAAAAGGRYRARGHTAAIRQLSLAYQAQLSYQLEGGGFSMFDRIDAVPSVWLTASTVRYMHKANRLFPEWKSFVRVDRSVIERAVSFLLSTQTSTGAFREPDAALVYDRKMASTFSEDNQKAVNVSLTAHVVIALHELSDLDGPLSARIHSAVRLARHYLEWSVSLAAKDDDAYQLAVTAYALRLVASPEAEYAFALLDRKAIRDGDTRYWSRQRSQLDSSSVFGHPGDLPFDLLGSGQPPVAEPLARSGQHGIDVETTAYALLAYLHGRAVLLKPIVEWLARRRAHLGGWASTRDSLVAMEALLEYDKRTMSGDAEERDLSMTITIEGSCLGSTSKQFHISSANRYILQRVRIPGVWGKLALRARGVGSALVQMAVTSLHQLPASPIAQYFSLAVKVFSSGDNHSKLHFRVCQSWAPDQSGEAAAATASGLAVLEAGLPTGYSLQRDTLLDYVNSGMARNLRHAQHVDGKAIFYFDYLDASPICINFTALRLLPTAVVHRRLLVKVYDYFEPERVNWTVVDLSFLHQLQVCDVCGSYQCIDCPSYNGASKANHSVSYSLTFLCLEITLAFSIVLAACICV